MKDRGELARFEPIKRKKPLARTGQRERRSRVRRARAKRKPQPLRELEERLRFGFRAAGKRCIFCGRTRGVEAHHGVPKHAIKALAAEWGLTEEETVELVWDSRNAMGVCRSRHARHTNASERMPLSSVPTSVWEFADGLGLGWRLEREYGR